MSRRGVCEPCWPRHASGTGRSHVTHWSHKHSADTGRCWLPGCAGEHRPAAPRSREGPGSCAPARQARWRTVWRSVEPLLKGTAVRCTSRAKRSSRSAWAYRTRTTTCRARRLRRVPGHRTRPRLPTCNAQYSDGHPPSVDLRRGRNDNRHVGVKLGLMAWQKERRWHDLLAARNAAIFPDC